MIIENLSLTPTLREHLQSLSNGSDALRVEEHKNPEHNAAPFVVVLAPKHRSTGELTSSEILAVEEAVAIHRQTHKRINTTTLAKSAVSAATTVARMREAFSDEATGQEAALEALRDAVWPALEAITSTTTIAGSGGGERYVGKLIRLGTNRAQDFELYLSGKGVFVLATPFSGIREVGAREAATACIWPIEGWVGMLAMRCEAVAEGTANKRANEAKRRGELLKSLAVILGSLENGR